MKITIIHKEGCPLCETAFPDATRKDTFFLPPEALTIVTDPSHELFDERALEPVKESLVADIMARGQLQPITVRKNGVEYEVVAGRQRTKAAREANKRLEQEGKTPIRVRTIIERGDEADMFGVMVLENELRQDNTPLAKAKLAQRLLDMGKPEDWVAMTFGVHKQTLRTYLSLLDLCTPVKNAVERGELSATAASKMSKLHHDEQKQMLDTMRAQGGPITAARTEKVSKGDAPPPMKRFRTRKEVEENLSGRNPYHEGERRENRDYADGYNAALRWLLCEDESN